MGLRISKYGCRSSVRIRIQNDRMLIVLRTAMCPDKNQTHSWPMRREPKIWEELPGKLFKNRWNYAEQVNPQRQHKGWWFPSAGGRGEWGNCLMGRGSFWVINMVWNQTVGGCTTLTILNATEL